MKRSKESAVDTLLDWCETIVLAFFVVILLFTFVFRIAEVTGISMQETLYEGDLLVVSHLFYTPENGDIIVVNSSALDDTIIKRIIATEGQNVSIDCDGEAVYVDGEKIDEPYLSYTSLDRGEFDMKYYNEDTDRFDYSVPDDCVFVMGDNRNHSLDSRSFGFVPEKEIVGRVVFRAFSNEHGAGTVE